jgi:hypothetical protein
MGVEGAVTTEATMGVREPWGTSAQTAVRWAFALLASGDAMPSILGNLRMGSKARRELLAQELRAQGAQIRGYVETIDDPVCRAYLIAYYLPKPMEERIEGGGKAFIDRFAAERSVVEQQVAVWLCAQQGTGVHRIRGYREIVAQYCLGQRLIERIRRLTRMPMGQDRVAKLLKMRKEEAAQRWDDCRRTLADLDKRAHALADEKLFSAGLL